MTRQPRSLRSPLLAAVAAAGRSGGCDENILNPMADRQPRVNAYRESNFYADGLAMRSPPGGHGPRERSHREPGAHHGRQTGQLSPATDLPDPGAMSQLLRTGQKRYNIICGTCHGPLGDGDSIVARQMALRPPPSLHGLRQPPRRLPLRGHQQGVRPDGVLRRRADRSRSAGPWWPTCAPCSCSRTATLDKAPLAERARLEKETP